MVRAAVESYLAAVWRWATDGVGGSTALAAMDFDTLTDKGKGDKGKGRGKSKESGKGNDGKVKTGCRGGGGRGEHCARLGRALRRLLRLLR